MGSNPIGATFNYFINYEKSYDREKESLTEFTNDEVSAYNDAYPETGLTAGNGEYLLL